MAQKKVTIVNIKKSSVDGKTHESTIFESLWIKEESKLKKRGFILKDQIESIVVEKVDDGLEFDEVIIEEPKVEEVVKEDTTEKSYSEMTKKELQAVCNEKGIKYHHANKKEKLIELLGA